MRTQVEEEVGETDEEVGGGGGGGGGDPDQEPPSCDPAAAFKEEALPAVLYLHGQIQIQAITNIFRQIKTKTNIDYTQCNNKYKIKMGRTTIVSNKTFFCKLSWRSNALKCFGKSWDFVPTGGRGLFFLLDPSPIIGYPCH